MRSKKEKPMTDREYLPEVQIGDVLEARRFNHSTESPAELEVTKEIKLLMETVAKTHNLDNVQDVLNLVFKTPEMRFIVFHSISPELQILAKAIKEKTGLSFSEVVGELKPYLEISQGEDIFFDAVAKDPEALADRISKEIMTPDLKG